jgi:hypothetical protein
VYEIKEHEVEVASTGITFIFYENGTIGSKAEKVQHTHRQHGNLANIHFSSRKETMLRM